MAKCVYLGDSRNGKETSDCRIHGECSPNKRIEGLARCGCCKQKLCMGDKDFAEKFKDYLLVTDRTNKVTTALRDLLAGGPAFLVCGGPSAKKQSLEKLNERGYWSLAINNMAGHFGYQPSAFVSSDPPSKFHDGIWLDPKVMKLIPTPKMKRRRGRLRHKNRDGTFENLMVNEKHHSACDCPNVWGFGRRAWLMPDDTFFLDVEAPWGNHNAGVLRTGQEKTVCTMLLGIRLLYYLGARTIFLVGVDFYMDESRKLCENYAFGEERSEGAVRSNNNQFSRVNGWLCKLQEDGVFDRFGLKIFNCFRNSGLRAFPFVPFESAIEYNRVGFPDEPFDLRGWYKK